MLEVLLLYLIIPGSINFLQLGRYGAFSEQRYRQQFSRKFDWLSFNATLAESRISSRFAIAFDPSYISKSGKCTPYLGRFWSGCAKMAKHGLEISGIGIIDMDLHTYFHLEAVQTPPVKTLEQAKWTLIDWYLHVLRTRKGTLQRLTKDTQMNATDVLDYYRTRFQIEFCYRDSKQFTGLAGCQSRDLNKLHFHFNTSLTSVNLAKVKALEKGAVLSMASVKGLCHNLFLMQRFISVLGMKPNEEINRRLWEEGIRFAAIAA